MKTKWKVVSPYTGIEEDAPANNASSGNVAMPPDAIMKKKKHTLIDRDGKIDGRTKAYREHRRKLEAARQKRSENRSSRFIESIKNKSEAYRVTGWVIPGVGSVGSLAKDVEKGFKNVEKFAKKKFPSKKSEMAYGQGFDTMKPVADMSNKDLQASKKKKKK